MDKVFRSIRFKGLPGRYVVPSAGEGGGAVNSVNGQQGNVVLDAEDVGAVDAQKVGLATPEDTQEVHIDFNGKLLTKPTGGGGGDGKIYWNE